MQSTNPSGPHVPPVTKGFPHRFPQFVLIFVAIQICCAGCLSNSEAELLEVVPVPVNGQTTPLTSQGKNQFSSIQLALAEAQPGDTIKLRDGLYFEDIHTVRHGEINAPITITGSPAAVLQGAGNSRIIQVHHDHIVIDGFTIDGQFRKTHEAASFRKKLIYAVSKTKGKGINGLKIQNMMLKNAADECLRLRYLVTNAEIKNNEIRNCGVLDFQFQGGGKNGEGIYLGTAPEQRNNGLSPDGRPDVSRDNWIHHNVIHTNGNECIDIKEAATANLIEHNICSGQRDPKSGGLDARGSGNTIRFNTVKDCTGAGVRLGGDEATDGLDNAVYGNKIRGCAGGGVKIERAPQEMICGNEFLEVKSSRYAVGKLRAGFKPALPCKESK